MNLVVAEYCWVTVTKMCPRSHSLPAFAARISSFIALYLSWHCFASFPGTHAAIFFHLSLSPFPSRARGAASMASARKRDCSAVHPESADDDEGAAGAAKATFATDEVSEAT